VLSVRPKTTELVFQVFGRPLHPELFHICETRTVGRGPYQAQVQITSAGHLIQWGYRNLVLAEVAASAQHPLVQSRRLMSYKLRGQRTDQMECRGGVRYQCSFQLEKVEPEVFWQFQEELRCDGLRRGILYNFSPRNRLAAGPLSFIHVETQQHGMLVQTFHTFPDEYAIVKTQSLFELP